MLSEYETGLQSLRLHYAKTAELQPHLDLVAAEGEVYVQYWLRPGDEAVEMALSEAGEREVVPGGVGYFLRCWGWGSTRTRLCHGVA